MTIRSITPEEIQLIAEVVGGPHLEEHGQGKFDSDRAVTWWSNLMKHANGVIFVAEDNGRMIGGISAFLCPDPYREGLIAQEGFWYVKPEYRHTRTGIKLFMRFEQWAHDNHVNEIRVGCMHGPHHASIEKYFISKGYAPFESHYAKGL